MPSINSVENVNVIIMFYDCKRNPFWSESINFFTRFNIHGMEMGTPLHYWTKHIWSPLRLIYYVARFIFIFFPLKVMKDKVGSVGSKLCSKKPYT